MPYAGGQPMYRERVEAATSAGYEGFALGDAPGGAAGAARPRRPGRPEPATMSRAGKGRVLAILPRDAAGPMSPPTARKAASSRCA